MKCCEKFEVRGRERDVSPQQHVEMHVKDRQHRSRGDIGISFITPKVNGSEDRAIYQTKAKVFSID